MIFDHVAHVSKVDLRALAGFAIQDLFGRPSFGVHDVAVNSGQANRFGSAITQRREDVGVDLSRENHLGHLQGRIVGDAPAFDDRLLNAHPRGEFAQLLAAAMDHADSYANLMQQGQLFRQRTQVFSIFGRLSGKLDDKSLTLKALDVR